jgi:hypothetical protein
MSGFTVAIFECLTNVRPNDKECGNRVEAVNDFLEGRERIEQIDFVLKLSPDEAGKHGKNRHETSDVAAIA